MQYIYSKHILIRMNERKILENEIEALINNEVDILIIPSKKDEKVIAILGFVNKKGLVIFVNKTTSVLITVRNMRKNEKILFKEKSNEKK